MEFVLSIVASVVAAILMSFCIALCRQKNQILRLLGTYRKGRQPDKKLWIPGGETLCENYTALGDEQKLDIIRQLSHSNAACYQDCGFLIDMLENAYLLESKRKLKRNIMKQIEENKCAINDLPYIQMT